jgi:hypothetical protein
MACRVRDDWHPRAGILLHCCYQFNSATKAPLPLQKRKFLRAKRCAKMHRCRPWRRPWWVLSWVLSWVPWWGALLGGCLVVSALLGWLGVGGLGRAQGANKGAIQGPGWRKKIERKAHSPPTPIWATEVGCPAPPLFGRLQGCFGVLFWLLSCF